VTIFYPDYSSYEGQATVPTGTPAIVAKATEGTYYIDADYGYYKTTAQHMGVPFSGYHFLKSDIDPAAQALYYWNFAGNTPCMLDVETEGASKPTVDQVVAFMTALKNHGGRVWGVYFPQWYWGQVGGDLGRVTASGAVLVASDYRAYSDSAWPGPYGGATPTVWQYTSTPIDMNAFKGTAAELADLINGDIVTPADIQAIAAAVYQYGQENVTLSDGSTLKNVPLGNLAHGSWVALNDPSTGVLKRLADIEAALAASGQTLGKL
jgi:hypothetical protein